MRIIEFIEKFPDEASCKDRFKTLRDEAGVTCKKCGTQKQYWLAAKEQYQCSSCGFRTTLRSGTLLQNSHLPYSYWFIAIHLLTSTKKSISALEMKKQLGHKRYRPIWEMMHKLRKRMGESMKEMLLEESVEMDEGFITAINPDADKDEKRKRGRGSQKKGKVVVMVESKDGDPKNKSSKRPAKKCGKVKMVVVDAISGENVKSVTKDNISDQATVITDGYVSYSEMSNLVNKHEQLLVPPKEASKLLPWVHIFISNAKRLFLNTFHKINTTYLQNYLDEFCYKANNRYNQNSLFNSLLNITIKI